MDDDMGAAADELLAFLCDVDAGDLPTDEWMCPPDKDTQDVPALTLLSDATNDVVHADSDAGSAASCSSDAAEHVAVHPSAPPKRRTRKQELALLRAQVVRMTLQLHSLKIAAGIDVSTPVAAVPQDQKRVLTVAAVSAGRAAPGCCLWEKLAAKQRTHRRDAEQENRMLREAVEVHARRAKRLRQMLHKRVADERRQLASVFTRPRAPIRISLPDDERVFLHLAEGMDEAYTEIDATFRATKMHELPVPGRSHRAHGLAPGKWRVELRDIHVTPFEFKRTERAAWVHLSNATDSNENELRSSIRFSFPHPSGVDFVMHQRSVTRRYRERECTVVLTRALTQPMPGISVDTTKRMVITRGERSVSGPTSVIQTYLFAFGSATAEAVQRVDEALRLRDRPLGTHVDDDSFGLKLWARSISKATDGIEDVLVAGDFDG